MAARDNEGFQQFSKAVYPVPTREQVEEAAAIAANLIDGQKSLGQSMQDPYTASVNYLEKHRIVEIFQVTMETPANEAPSYTQVVY